VHDVAGIVRTYSLVSRSLREVFACRFDVPKLTQAVTPPIPAPAPVEGPRVGYRCPDCGSDHVGYEATSRWDVETQSWVLGHSYDDGWCNDCGDVEPERYTFDAEEVEAGALMAAEASLAAALVAAPASSVASVREA